MLESMKYQLKIKLCKEKANKSPTVVNFILDKSGSMESMKDAVISGFNEYVGNLHKQKNLLFSFTLFDSNEIEKRYVAEPIKTVATLTRDTFVPGSATPLYDAICETIKEASEKLDKDYEKYASLVVIMTDGMENSSSKYTMQDFVKLKNELEKKGNWTFVFMGANQDAWATAQKYGFSVGNTLNWTASSDGAKSAMRSLSENTVMYASAMSGTRGGSGMLNTTNFFSGSNANLGEKDK